MKHVKAICCRAETDGSITVAVQYTKGAQRNYHPVHWRRQSRLAYRIYLLSKAGRVTLRPYLIGYAGWSATRY